MNIRSGIGWRLTVTSNNLLLACDHRRTREVGKPDPLLACDHYCIVEVEKPDPCLCQRHGARHRLHPSCGGQDCLRPRQGVGKPDPHLCLRHGGRDHLCSRCGR
ncbi:hypothetical protein BHE74_00009529 [Ensete ventricosum]|nr:hypothetical protein BHE74_00009529 [Ensete ventricosum]